MKKWESSEKNNMKYVGLLEVEVYNKEDKEFDSEYFEIYETDTRLLFGSHCNCGFLESGYMEKDSAFRLDENIQELTSELETFYQDGIENCEKIICNERM